MNTHFLLVEELHNPKIINRLVDYIWASYCVGNRSFDLKRILNKSDIEVPDDWQIFCSFGRTLMGKERASATHMSNRLKEGGIFIQTHYPDGDFFRSEEDMKISIHHEIIHLLDYIKIINKNSYVTAKSTKRKYESNSLSYYASELEFNQLIHFIEKLSHKVKFKSYESLFTYLSADTAIEVSMLKDKSFMRRLVNRLNREHINIIKRERYSMKIQMVDLKINYDGIKNDVDNFW